MELSRNSIIISAIGLTFLLGLIVIPNAEAAVDMFLKIEGVQGESQDKAHKDEIDVLAWSWGMSQSGTTHIGGGGGAGKVNVQDLSFTKFMDKSTPFLLLKCANGERIGEATLVVRKAGDTPIEFFKLKLNDLIVSSVSTGGSGGEDRLTENVTLNFSKVQWTYQEQDSKGNPVGSGITSGWNVAENTKT